MDPVHKIHGEGTFSILLGEYKISDNRLPFAYCSTHIQVKFWSSACRYKIKQENLTVTSLCSVKPGPDKNSHFNNRT